MGIYERVLELKIKGMNWEKNGLPCLLGILPVFVCRILAISARFSGVLGLLISSLYIIYSKRILRKKLEVCSCARKRPVVF